MVCPKCGRRTFRRETVCPKCGAPMPADPRTKSQGDSDLNGVNSFSSSADNSPVATLQPDSAEQKVSTTPEQQNTPADEEAPLFFTPELEFPVNSHESQSDSSAAMPEFYGSYGEICNDGQSEPVPQEIPNEISASNTEETSSADGCNSPDTSDLPDFSVIDDKPSKSIEFDENAVVNPMPVDSEEDDELVLPDMSGKFTDSANASKKSMGYEETVKLKNARKAYKNEVPINEPIQSGGRRESVAPKIREYVAVASGTAKVKGDLPKLKENQMYIAVTPKEFRQLKSRKFRGLGILCTLCLVIIASFCIWSYANSFADPLVGRWKGDVASANIPIQAIQQLDQDIMPSTWEFSSSGSMYLNITVNDTPISLSGSYVEQRDENGGQYLSMTLSNPMDGSEYTINMYYTVTGRVLEFSDMEGLGMTIDLNKE